MKGDNESEGVTVAKRAAEPRDDDDDARRLTLLFHEYHARIQQFARRRVGTDAAQEIVAETFLVAWRRLHDIPDPALPWLYRVASLEVANFQRRQVRSIQIEQAIRQSLRGEQSPRLTSDHLDESQVIARAFECLEPSDQEILRLATWDGLTSAEGAVVLGCSVSAYRVRLHRARGRLARKSRLASRGTFPTPRGVEPNAQPRPGPAPPTKALPMRGAKEAG